MYTVLFPTDPKESHAIPESEAQVGPKIEAVYTQEESFEQEWCASLMQVTELACVKDEEVPQQECVPIKEEFTLERNRIAALTVGRVSVT